MALLAGALALALHGASQGPVHGWLSSGAAPYYVTGGAVVGALTWDARE